MLFPDPQTLYCLIPYVNGTIPYGFSQVCRLIGKATENGQSPYFYCNISIFVYNVRREGNQSCFLYISGTLLSLVYIIKSGCPIAASPKLLMKSSVSSAPKFPNSRIKPLLQIFLKLGRTDDRNTYVTRSIERFVSLFFENSTWNISLYPLWDPVARPSSLRGAKEKSRWK